MQELIKVSQNENGKQVVSARNLHEWLETKDHFTQWMTRMLEYGFSKDVDYQAINEFVKHINGIGGTNKIDYVLTLDCAKEISMIQRTEKGKQARLYFIECEKLVKNNLVILPNTYIEALEALLASEKSKLLIESNLKVLESSNSELLNKIDNDKHKVVFADSVSGASNSILIREFAKLLCNDNFKIGQNKLYEWLRDERYLNIKNEPYQTYINMGIFEIITRPIVIGKENATSTTTKITGKGQVYLTEKIKNKTKK